MPQIMMPTDPLYYAICSLRYAGEGIEPSTANVPAITSEARTLKHYETTIGSLGELLQQYQALLQRDCSSLETVQSNMEGFDRLAADKFTIHLP